MKDYPRIALVKGNVVETYPKFVESNSPLISALFLHIETYQAEKAILEAAWPYLARGSVIVSSTLGNYNSPGVMRALMDTVGISSFRIVRSSFTSKMSYFVKD